MVGRSTTNQILLLFAEFLSVHHGKSPFQCLSESMSLALKKGVKSPSSIVSPWYPKAFPCSFIFFLPVCLVSLVVQIQIIIIHQCQSSSLIHWSSSLNHWNHWSSIIMNHESSTLIIEQFHPSFSEDKMYCRCCQVRIISESQNTHIYIYIYYFTLSNIIVYSKK